MGEASPAARWTSVPGARRTSPLKRRIWTKHFAVFRLWRGNPPARTAGSKVASSQRRAPPLLPGAFFAQHWWNLAELGRSRPKLVRTHPKAESGPTWPIGPNLSACGPKSTDFGPKLGRIRAMPYLVEFGHIQAECGQTRDKFCRSQARFGRLVGCWQISGQIWPIWGVGRVRAQIGRASV